MVSKPVHIKTESDNKLLKELHSLINKKVGQLPKSRINQLKIKLFTLPLIHLGIYAFALNQIDRLWLFYISYSLMGLMTVIIFCELIHELSHNNIFIKPQHNALALKLFDLLGANSFIWQQRHLKLHHRFPNVNGWDADIEQKGPVSIFPNEEKKHITKYQHLYVFLLYPLFMINWLVIRDFRDFFSDKRLIQKTIVIPRIEYFKLFLFKFIYFFMIVGIPIIFAGFSVFQTIIGLIILTVSGSILAMIVLLTPHINSGNEFPQTDLEGKINVSWFRHQLITTNDIDNSNWYTRNVMGNFNYHVAHHLFPKISSVYAPEVTEILKSFCKEHNLPYKSYPMKVAFKKHYELIRKNAIAFHQIDI
jgi:linoleoyl-CoA desaturase